MRAAISFAVPPPAGIPFVLEPACARGFVHSFVVSLTPATTRWRTLCALAATLTFALTGRAEDWAPNLTLTGAWHDNASNGIASADQIDSLQLHADVVASQRYSFGRHDALHLTAHFAGEWWPRFDQLLGGAAGARAEWRHMFGVGKLAPTFSIEGCVDAVTARETGRRGTSSGVMVELRKRLNTHWRVALSHEFARFDARYAVYDRTSSETAVELGYDLNDLSRLIVTGRYRDGDVVSYAENPSAELAALARVSQPVDTFDRPLIASSFDARSWAARVAFVRALDEFSAIVVAYELGKTREQPLEFTNQILSVAIVHQF